MLYRIGLHFSLLLYLITGSASAASVNLLRSQTSTEPAIILIEGELIAGDEKAFTRTVLEIDEAVVVLNSNGGALIAGLGIGKAIRLKQFATMVGADNVCASACALSWLGGTRRFLHDSAKIGFHAAYTNENGNLKESGMANALVGSYLNQLGLRENAIAYITKASPDSIQWLTTNDAQSLGIDVESFRSENASAEGTPTPSTQDEFRTATGVDLFGYDLPGMPLKGLKLSNCIDSCAAHASCKAFTYSSKSKSCFLKSNADLAVLYGPATSGFQPGLKDKIRQSMLNILQRTDIVGNDYRSVDDVTMENCLRVCDSDDGCRAFSYIPKKRQCWLKNTATGTTPKIGVVSGLK